MIRRSMFERAPSLSFPDLNNCGHFGLAIHRDRRCMIPHLFIYTYEETETYKERERKIKRGKRKERESKGRWRARYRE